MQEKSGGGEMDMKEEEEVVKSEAKGEDKAKSDEQAKGKSLGGDQK